MISTERALLIRVAIAGSLALLITGAVAPLLTTEQFYFFSNTFSLVSGLGELVAKDQLLIAVVVGLFSLCVPAIKAIVIWMAASPAASRHVLLVLADKFGKWSMLEVFVAALLLIALKLGPVVDATLHYGAYLLAASVLLSGLASQLLTHEPDSRPLFSSPATLTAGAVGGAIAATLLIGLMNPELLRFEAIIGTPESRCIQRVAMLDRYFAMASADQTDYVASLSDIDATDCPDDFREALNDYVAAWSELAASDDDAETEPGWLDHAAALIGLSATREDRLDDIEAARARIERVALEHGVEITR